MLSRAIIVTFSRFNGKDHGIKLPPSAEADLFWGAGTGSEFTACYVSHTKQRTWASALTASAVSMWTFDFSQVCPLKQLLYHSNS